MSDAVQIAIIVAAGPLILGIYNSWQNHRQSSKLEVVHKEFNGMKDQLVAVTKTEAHAAGMKEQKDNTDAKAL